MKIGHRLTAALTTVVIGAVSIFLFIELSNRKLDRENELIERAEDVALALRSAVELAGYPVDQDDAESIAEELSESSAPWTVRIFSTDYINQATDTPSIARAKRILVDKIEVLISKGESEYSVSLPLRAKTDLFPKGFRMSGTLELAHSTTRLKDENRTELLKFCALIGLLFFLLILFGLALSKILITTPIRKLLEGVGDVAEGDLSPVLLSEREDEIGDLATRFNTMTQSLRESRAETIKENAAKAKLENQLFKSEKLATIGQIAAEIAHEVGTPLNVIAGRARNMAKKVDDKEAVIKNSEIVAEQTDRITRIIQRLLDFSRRKVGTIEKQLVDVNELIEKTMAFLEGKLKHSNIEANVYLEDTPPQVFGNPDKIQQIFLNLLINAIEAMPHGGKLDVSSVASLERRPGLINAPQLPIVQISIKDSGPGIPPEHRKSVFEPFYSTKESQGGTGLGLSVVHGIVKEHDGWAEILDAPEKGATFRVCLPLAKTKNK